MNIEKYKQLNDDLHEARKEYGAGRLTSEQFNMIATEIEAEKRFLREEDDDSCANDLLRRYGQQSDDE